MATQPGAARRRDLIPLVVLLLGTFLLSAVWAFSTPVVSLGTPAGAEWGNFHPDELSHISVIRYMAQKREFPPYQSPYDTSVHPPLYHGLGALIYTVAVPLIGDTGAILGVRLMSALCGVGTVYLVFAATRRVASRETALLAGTFVALIPMRVSLGGAVTNENLAALGSAGALAALVGGLWDRQGFTSRRILVLTTYIAIGVGSKVTCLGLFPAAILALFLQGRGRGIALSKAAAQSTVLILGSAICWGWWFVRNQIVYGDPLRQAAANRLWDKVQPGFAVLSVQKHQSAFGYGLSLLTHGWMSFWGKFDGFRYYMPFPAYLFPLFLEVIAIVGWWQLLRGQALRGDSPLPDNPIEGEVRPGDRLRAFRSLLLVFGIYAATVLIIYMQYNWRHYTPQGRYFFVLLLPFGFLTAIGYQAALTREVRQWATPILIGLMIALNLYVLYVVPRRIGFLPIFPVGYWQKESIARAVTGVPPCRDIISFTTTYRYFKRKEV